MTVNLRSFKLGTSPKPMPRSRQISVQLHRKNRLATFLSPAVMSLSFFYSVFWSRVLTCSIFCVCSLSLWGKILDKPFRTSWQSMRLFHRLNMEMDLQSLFGLVPRKMAKMAGVSHLAFLC